MQRLTQRREKTARIRVPPHRGPQAEAGWTEHGERARGCARCLYGRRSVWIEPNEDQREWPEERVAILEYEAGVPRRMAEA